MHVQRWLLSTPRWKNMLRQVAESFIPKIFALKTRGKLWATFHVKSGLGHLSTPVTHISLKIDFSVCTFILIFQVLRISYRNSGKGLQKIHQEHIVKNIVRSSVIWFYYMFSEATNISMSFERRPHCIKLTRIRVFTDPCSCKHTTCISRWNDVETSVSTPFERGIHMVCL